MTLSPLDTHHSDLGLVPKTRTLSVFPEWNSSILRGSVKQRRNDEDRKSYGSYRKVDQLPTFLEEIEKISDDLNKDYLDYDYQEKDDSFDGRITRSLKGLHCTPTLYR